MRQALGKPMGVGRLRLADTLIVVSRLWGDHARSHHVSCPPRLAEVPTTLMSTCMHIRNLFVWWGEHDVNLPKLSSSGTSIVIKTCW